jgi:hypothetical protein
VQRFFVITGFAVVCFIVIRLFLFEGHTVGGSEMLPGAVRGDVIISDRFYNGLRLPFFNNTKIFSFIKHDRGDLVFIKHPWYSQSGIAEFFDFLTLSIFGIAGDTEIRLVRVLARGNERVRIAADGTVFVSGEQLPRERMGTLELEVSSLDDGALLRQGRYDKTLLYQEKVSPDLASPIQSRYAVYTEGEWRIAQADADPLLAEARVFPQAVTTRAQALTIAENWLMRAIFRGSKYAYQIIEVPSGDFAGSQAASEDEFLIHIRFDAEGNLSYQVGAGEQKALISVENGIAWLIVPEGMLFVLNDFREAQADSRTWGPVYAETVTGIPFLRPWPLSRFGTLE